MIGEELLSWQKHNFMRGDRSEGTPKTTGAVIVPTCAPVVLAGVKECNKLRLPVESPQR